MKLHFDQTIEDSDHVMVVIELVVKEPSEPNLRLRHLDGRWQAMSKQLKQDYPKVKGELVLVKTGQHSRNEYRQKTQHFALTFKKG